MHNLKHFAVAAAVALVAGLAFVFAGGGEGSPAPSATEEAAAEPDGLPPRQLLESVLPADTSTLTVAVSRTSLFVWPASGRLTSYFGPGHPQGIDIGLDHGEDSPILASGAGTVTYAGGPACCSYGLHVTIDHGNGFVTLYGHLSKILVEEGQEVGQGELLGFGGETGETDGKHLHFELQRDGTLVDPLRWLPPSEDFAAESAAVCPDEPMSIAPASFVTLALDAEVFDGFAVAETLWQPLTGGPVPELVVNHEDGAVFVSAPEALAATGRPVAYALEVHFLRGEEQVTLVCEVLLETMATGRNSENTAARLRAQRAARAAPPPTLTPTPTPWIGPPSPTPVPKALPTNVPPTAVPAKQAPEKLPDKQPVKSQGPKP